MVQKVNLEMTDGVQEELDKRAIYVGSVEELEALDTAALKDGQQVNITGWHAGSEVGGGNFVFRAAQAKSLHNGVTHFSPTVPKVSEQAGSTLWERRDNYLAGAGETDPAGSGVFVREERESITSYQAGALHDNASDDLKALDAARDALAENQLLIIAHGTALVSNEFKLKSNSKYLLLGTIKLTAATTGGALIAPYDVSNVEWFGGTLDANNISGQNCIGTAGSAGNIDNIVFRGVRTINALWDATIFGGKGFTIHQNCTAVRYYDMIVDDCSIGFSVEGFDTRPSTGNIIDGVIIRRATRIGAWMFQGSVNDITNPDNLQCLIDNVVLEDCVPAAGFGIISVDRANAIQARFYINNRTTTAEVTPFKGTAVNSRFEVDADINNISNALDFTVIGNGQPDADSEEVIIDMKLKVSGTSAGNLVKFLPGTNDLNRSSIKVAYTNFTGSGLMSHANSTIYYDFLRLTDGYRVKGRSSAVPTFKGRETLESVDSFAIDNLLLTSSVGNQLTISKPVLSGWHQEIRDGDSNPIIRTKSPASGESAILLRYHNGASVVLGTVTVGEVDSGGVGYKVLRVPN